MYTKKHLGFTGLRKVLSKRFSRIPDHRSEADYRMHDVLMGGLAMMYFQDPSLLQFEKRSQCSKIGNNLKTMFGLESIMSDTQMREVMDEVDPDEIQGAFRDFFRLLQRGKHLEEYRVLNNYYLCVLDGSEYFGSEKVHCASCLTQEIKKKRTRYSHQIVQAAVVHPKKSQVIPLAPEEVKNTDGKEKQDCETNAGKRLLEKIRKAHPGHRCRLTLQQTADHRNDPVHGYALCAYGKTRRPQNTHGMGERAEAPERSSPYGCARS
jgi:CRISPR type III-B/RAMP module RAMP protein Cmr1